MKLTLLAILLLLLGCNHGGSQKLPASNTSAIINKAGNSRNIRSMLTSRNDEVLIEAYFKSYHTDSLDHVRSVTKSVLSSLIGIAIDMGFIGSIEDTIEMYIEEVPDDKKVIRLKHLLQMTSGILWSESQGVNDNTLMVRSENEYRFVLQKPMAYKPGVHFEYSTGDYHLLSVILTHATGMSAALFAEKYLFSPLRIKKYKWEIFDDGYYAGGSRLELHPKDMLKLGRLWMNKGFWEGERVVPSTYLQKAIRMHHTLSVFDEGAEGYGFGFWVLEYSDVNLFIASGYGGQEIVVSPKEKFISVITYEWNVDSKTAIRQQMESRKLAQLVWEWSNRSLD